MNPFFIPDEIVNPPVQQIYVPAPDPKTFENQARTGPEQVMGEPQSANILEKILYPPEGGIYIKFLGIEHLKKCWPFPEAVNAINQVKRILVGLVSGLVSKQMILPLIGFGLLPWKQKIKLIEKFLEGFVRTSDWILNICYLKEEYYCISCRELWKLVYQFMMNLGFGEEISYKTAKVFITLIEYDNVYRAVLQDLFDQTSNQALISNPRAELKQLEAVYISRANKNDGLIAKYHMFFLAFSYALIVPRVKKAFLKAIKSIDVNKLKPDEADKYWMLTMGGYDFMGKTIEQRVGEYREIHKGKMPFQMRLKKEYF